jgi:dinuclear metal center YbgI/SA1388 family protein
MGKNLTVKDLLATLEKIASFDLAAEWDNVGLMVGDPHQLIRGILVALDPTQEVLVEAKEIQADCIITHHPLIFHPPKAIYANQPLGRFLRCALENEITVISCHTNLDQAVGGVNDVLASTLGLFESKPLARTAPESGAEVNAAASGAGFGRIGRFVRPMNRQEFIEHLCAHFNLPLLRVAGCLPAEITTVAVCGGSGSELAETAFANGAEVYVTGEVKHSTARWAEAAGFCIVDAGHFATEIPVVTFLTTVLQEVLTDLDIHIPVTATVRQQNPFCYHGPQT